jgi:trk system potassium uptake protein TrkA
LYGSAAREYNGKGPAHIIILVPARSRQNGECGVHIIVVGCGRVGARVAEMLHLEHDIVVVDENAHAFDRLPLDFRGVTLLGEASDTDILRQAGIEHADALCALTQRDNMNIMISQIARRIFNVPLVVTRIYDPPRAEVYRSLGMTVICPTEVGVDYIEELLAAPLPGRPALPRGQ